MSIGESTYTAGYNIANIGNQLGQESQTYSVYGTYQSVQVSPGQSITLPSTYMTTYSGRPGGSAQWFIDGGNNPSSPFAQLVQDLLKPGNMYPMPSLFGITW
ncbi:hypothetical protein [Vulcanisaeta distributa]|uniref:hypothetical protein n=1 Tax=Vulcanisaeta distributa TaxID=164451 RepID=UPI0006D1D4A6|nr:hypothetical protein [Vulcanisaeta distributa]